MRAKVIAAALIALGSQAGVAVAQGASASPSSIPPRGPAAVTAPSPTPSSAEAEQEVLLHSNAKLGGYGGPDTRFTSVLAEPALLVGGQASWLVKHQYLFGIAGYGLATRVDAPNTMQIDGNSSRLGLVYGGIRLGVVATPNSLLHLTVSALAGPGSLTGISNVPTRAEFEVGYERRLGHAETFFVLEPEVAVETNVTSFMRIALGASYRYVTGIEQPGLSM
ncbi:MAG: hypothetical protein ABW133_20115, partial [Polyangiaceae bacterium]